MILFRIRLATFTGSLLAIASTSRVRGSARNRERLSLDIALRAYRCGERQRGGGTRTVVCGRSGTHDPPSQKRPAASMRSRCLRVI